MNLSAEVMDLIEKTFHTFCGDGLEMAGNVVSGIVVSVFEGTPFEQIGPYNITNILREEIGKIVMKLNNSIAEAGTSLSGGGGVVSPRRICTTDTIGLAQVGKRNNVVSCETLGSGEVAEVAGIDDADFFAFGIQYDKVLYTGYIIAGEGQF